MYLAELFSLAAALCWSFGGLLSTDPARALGAVNFNRTRMSLVFAMLSLAALVNGGWWTLNRDHFLLLITSSIIGICVGDTSLFAALRRIGPRRNGILFATNAPITALLGYYILDERLPTLTAIGCGLITLGVVLAVFFGATEAQQHSFEKIRGSLGAGVALALFAATCQAVSLIIVRPVLVSGVDAVAASALRVGTAAVILNIVLLFRTTPGASASPLTARLLGSGFPQRPDGHGAWHDLSAGRPGARFGWPGFNPLGHLPDPHPAGALGLHRGTSRPRGMDRSVPGRRRGRMHFQHVNRRFSPYASTWYTSA